MREKKFSWKKRAKSFVYAWQGINALLHTEHNSRIHLACTILLVVLGWLLHISSTEAVLLTGIACLVWMAELFNTAIEKTADMITLEKHPQIRLIKDMAAAAVLIASAAALLGAAIVFLPKIIDTCKNF